MNSCYLRFPILILFMLSFLLSACGQGIVPSAGNLATKKIKVVTTTGMIADIVKNVGGERVDVTALMGPGVDPHLYKPTAGDSRTLEQADIIFYNGLELEGRMTDIFVKLARTKLTVPISEDIPEEALRSPTEFEGKYDPHIWFDVSLWQTAVKTVNKHLAKFDSGSAALYQKNTDTYLTQLEQLHQETKAAIAKLPAQSRVLITAHDAFGYFGQAYGMEVRGLQGTSTQSEPGADDVQELTTFIVDRKIKAIFVESSVPKATIEAVQAAVRARGWNVAIGDELFSDAMGNAGTPEGTYIGMVRHNVNSITKALS